MLNTFQKIMLTQVLFYLFMTMAYQKQNILRSLIYIILIFKPVFNLKEINKQLKSFLSVLKMMFILSQFFHKACAYSFRCKIFFMLINICLFLVNLCYFLTKWGLVLLIEFNIEWYYFEFDITYVYNILNREQLIIIVIK